MAYTTGRRAPLLGAQSKTFVLRRLSELLGLLFLGGGIYIALILTSFSAGDTVALVTGDTVHNWGGAMGAKTALFLLKIAGFGSWGVVAVLIVWGLRFIVHIGASRFLSRAVYAPFFWLFCALFVAALPALAPWVYSFPMGGFLGNTLLLIILKLIPTAVTLQANAVIWICAALCTVSGFFVMGGTFKGTYHSTRTAILWFILAIWWGLHALWRGALALMRRKERTPEGALEGRNEQQLAEGIDSPSQPKPTGGKNSLLAKIRSVLQTYQNKDASLHTHTPLAMRTEPVISAEEQTIYEAPAEQEPILSDASTAPPAPTLSKRSRAPSRKAVQERQPDLLGANTPDEQYIFPPLSILTDPSNTQRSMLSEAALQQNAELLENVLDDYGVKGTITNKRPGPVVTMYEFEPAPGIKASRIIGLADDIARSMSAISARVSTVPGRSIIGIELPNETREMVTLRELIQTSHFGDSKMQLPLALGKDIGGSHIIENLAKMPHLLIAGTTGSGKSVAINTMILSLLYRRTPDECRLIMIDPKMLELSVYDGIPHLLSPVVTDPKKAIVALKWAVNEMEERYRKMSKMGVRSIVSYNDRVSEALAKGKMFSRTIQTGFDDETGEPLFQTEEYMPEKMPYIVVIVDEMADLMMVAGKEIEACIQRLAQMARASGIHLIMATQRPSVDVITGTIKANFPTRISFQVTSKVDSRTILGEMGAEQLLGMGDMLYMAGGGKITRVHGPFCSDEEVEKVVSRLKENGPPDYLQSILDGPDESTESDIDAILGLGGNTDGENALYDTAVQIVIKDRKCSTSYIQRKLAIGYNKAARLVDQMEEAGLISAANHVGKREILIPEQE